MTELKSCPFCGGVVEVTAYVVYGRRKAIKGTFKCLLCHATFSIIATYTQSPFEALYSAWNRRAAAPNE